MHHELLWVVTRYDSAQANHWYVIADTEAAALKRAAAFAAVVHAGESAVGRDYAIRFGDLPYMDQVRHYPFVLKLLRERVRHRCAMDMETTYKLNVPEVLSLSDTDWYKVQLDSIEFMHSVESNAYFEAIEANKPMWVWDPIRVDFGLVKP
jgi:hypothetical protein